MVWYHFTKKQTTDELLKLSIGWLKKQKSIQENSKINGELCWKRYCDSSKPTNIASINFLSNFIGGNKYIELSYTYNNQEAIRYKIQIDTSIPNYGGKRYWFICPKCNRKVAFLYLRKTFLCRHCNKLTYKTQQVGYSNRMSIKSQKYKNRVMKNDNKKRWVHWKTFYNTMDKADYYEDLSYINFYKKICKMIRY